MITMEERVKRVYADGPLCGVCSTCQQSGIELIYEDEHTVLQEHEAFGKHCLGSYDFPETCYRVKQGLCNANVAS